jgi:hypothetical protein
MTKDKKQILVLGVLFAVILAVGAFQFMGGSKGKQAATKEDDHKKVDEAQVAVNDDQKDPVREAVNQLFSNPIVPRDPFVPQAVIVDDPTPDNGQHPTVIHNPGPMPGDLNNGGNTGVDVVHPPVDPNQIGLTPTDPPKDAWALRGVMIGKRGTLAMVEDHTGRQFLVKEGDSIADHTTVLSISKTGVELMANGKPIHLALLGGN